MKAELVVLSGADGDLLSKYVELDAWSEPAANAFEADVQQAFDLICANPFIGSKHSHPPFRKWLLAEWDLAVFYRPQGNRCFIHGVLNMRQDPENIRAILKSRTPQ